MNCVQSFDYDTGEKRALYSPDKTNLLLTSVYSARLYGPPVNCFPAGHNRGISFTCSHWPLWSLSRLKGTRDGVGMLKSKKRLLFFGGESSRLLSPCTKGEEFKTGFTKGAGCFNSFLFTWAPFCFRDGSPTERHCPTVFIPCFLLRPPCSDEKEEVKDRRTES